jgi:hypothetical protein
MVWVTRLTARQILLNRGRPDALVLLVNQAGDFAGALASGLPRRGIVGDVYTYRAADGVGIERTIIVHEAVQQVVVWIIRQETAAAVAGHLGEEPRVLNGQSIALFNLGRTVYGLRKLGR